LLEGAVKMEDLSRCVNEYIDNLPSDYKAVLVLRELEGLSNREIADILEISLDNVKIRLYRAMAKLRELLSDGCDFYHNEQDVFACDRKPSHIFSKTPK
jgi:RNA polymerase sigma-70 factor, ECF subfamily